MKNLGAALARGREIGQARCVKRKKKYERGVVARVKLDIQRQSSWSARKPASPSA